VPLPGFGKGIPGSVILDELDARMLLQLAHGRCRQLDGKAVDLTQVVDDPPPTAAIAERAAAAALALNATITRARLVSLVLAAVAGFGAAAEAPGTGSAARGDNGTAARAANNKHRFFTISPTL
jgi:hypothetical protein